MEPVAHGVDKAVSTEDLALVTRDIHLEVARLEAMLNTLVENKVESMKADKGRGDQKSGEKHSQRITSTSTASAGSSSQRATAGRCPRKRRQVPHRDSDHDHAGHGHRRGRSRCRSSTNSPEMSPRFQGHHRWLMPEVDHPCCEHAQSAVCSDDEDIDDLDGAFDFLAYADHRAYIAVCDVDGATTCSCADNHNGQLKPPFDDDYVSINIEDFENVEEEAIITHDAALRRARRKRRKRRKKRKKRLQRERERQRLALATVATTIEKVKIIDPDDLPQRARWTIVATACLLLLMCLLLVGVTLRMAPIIDDMGELHLCHFPVKSRINLTEE